MARIKKDFDSHTREDLLAEARARNLENVTSHISKADLVAALELDNESANESDKTVTELPTPSTPNDSAVDPRDARIKELEAMLSQAQSVPRAPALAVPTGIDLDTYKDGAFKRVGSDEVFKLKIVKDDPIGRTHHLKNTEHYAELSEADFRSQFEKA